MKKLPDLVIGDLVINPPIIQGGMGVMVSMSSLAAAVADCGCAGVISGVGLGYGTKENDIDYISASREGLRREIRKTRATTKGVVGVNLMAALYNYDDLVLTAVSEGIDFIVSGAGLPFNLPELVKGSNVKIVPIVSSGRAANIIVKKWLKGYNRLPDAIIVEGPLAGGHLGFSKGELLDGSAKDLDVLVSDVLNIVKPYSIPVIAAGGIFDGKDLAYFLKLGASGVQMATRFVATNECGVHQAFKDAYVNAKDDDIMIINSPVGMPGRVVKNKFAVRMLNGEIKRDRCTYHCLKVCEAGNAPYCIIKALYNAANGNMDEALIFAGHRVSSIDRVISVKSLIDEVASEAFVAMHAEN